MEVHCLAGVLWKEKARKSSVRRGGLRRSEDSGGRYLLTDRKNASLGRTRIRMKPSRLFGCVLGEEHLWSAITCVERNPVRAGIVEKVSDYPWLSAGSHVTGVDRIGLLDMERWTRQDPKDWEEALRIEECEKLAMLRDCKYAGRPFGTKSFVTEMGEKFGRK